MSCGSSKSQILDTQVAAYNIGYQTVTLYQVRAHGEGQVVVFRPDTTIYRPFFSLNNRMHAAHAAMHRAEETTVYARPAQLWHPRWTRRGLPVLYHTGKSLTLCKRSRAVEGSS